MLALSLLPPFSRKIFRNGPKSRQQALLIPRSLGPVDVCFLPMSDFEDVCHTLREASAKQLISTHNIVPTRGILGIQHQHLAQHPAPLGNELFALCIIPPPSPSSYENCIVQYDKLHGVIDLVSGRIQCQDTVHLSDNVASWHGRYIFSCAFNLRVKRLHLVGVEDTKVSHRRTNVAATI